MAGIGGSSLAIGVYVRGFPTDRLSLDRYTRLTGHRPGIVHIFRNWSDATRKFDPAMADAVLDAGSSLMISWQPGNDLESIGSGGCDEYVREYARAVAAWNQPLLIRFAHEMNGSWIPWAASGEVFVAAWRRIHALFAEEGAGNVAWVWSPHARDRRAADFRPYYPGPDTVDWVALDGYNWGRSQLLSGWRSFDDIFGPSYRQLRAFAPDKPMMIAEVGCAEEGGDKAAWIRHAFTEALPERFKDVSAVVWFHARVRGHADWRVDSSPEALDAWRDVVRAEGLRVG